MRVSGKRTSGIRGSTCPCRVRIVDECTFPVTDAGSGRAPGETRRVSQVPGPDERAGPADHGADGPVRVSGDQFSGRRVNPARGSERILIIFDLPRLWCRYVRTRLVDSNPDHREAAVLQRELNDARSLRKRLKQENRELRAALE